MQKKGIHNYHKILLDIQIKSNSIISDNEKFV